MSQRWLLYALGGGLGHFQRSMALARAAAKCQIQCTLMANTEWLSGLPTRSPWVPDLTSIHRLRADVSASESRVAFEALLSQGWDAVIVDTFPRGLGGELVGALANFDGKKVLTHRDISEVYLGRYDVRRYVVKNYDLSLSPGDHGPLEDLCACTNAWLIAEPDEMIPRSAARQQWRCDTDQIMVLVMASGRRSEQSEMKRAAESIKCELPGAFVRVVALGDPCPFEWPLFPSLTAADVVVGAGGYNAVRETEALDVPYIGRAQPRMYDRQWRRLAGAAHCYALREFSEKSLFAGIEWALNYRRANSNSSTSVEEAKPTFANGATLAVQTILKSTSA